MKYLFSALLILIAVVCIAQGLLPVGSCVNNHGASCTTQAAPTDLVTYASNFFEIHTASATKYVSSKFIAGETASICKIDLYLMSETGTSPTYNQTLYIYGDTGGEPNEADVKGTFETRNMTGVLTGSFAWVTWTTESPVSLNSGTTYHIVTMSSAYDNTNIQRWGYDSNCCSNNCESMFRAADGATWTSVTTSNCGMARLYK